MQCVQRCSKKAKSGLLTAEQAGRMMGHSSMMKELQNGWRQLSTGRAIKRQVLAAQSVVEEAVVVAVAAVVAVVVAEEEPLGRNRPSGTLPG